MDTDVVLAFFIKHRLFSLVIAFWPDIILMRFSRVLLIFLRPDVSSPAFIYLNKLEHFVEHGLLPCGGKNPLSFSPLSIQ